MIAFKWHKDTLQYRQHFLFVRLCDVLNHVDFLHVLFEQVIVFRDDQVFVVIPIQATRQLVKFQHFNIRKTFYMIGLLLLPREDLMELHEVFVVFCLHLFAPLIPRITFVIIHIKIQGI